MISEGSCDTEDWSNDAENLLRNKLHLTIFKYKSDILNFNNCSQYFCLYSIWSKHFKNHTNTFSFVWPSKKTLALADSGL